MAKYKSKDGSYLDIDERRGVYHLVWVTHMFGGMDIGGSVGDHEHPVVPGIDATDEDRIEAWEVNTADATAKPFSCGRSSDGFEFEIPEQDTDTCRHPTPYTLPNMSRHKYKDEP